jgi:polyhydroxyalkanoate synthesis regulator phasin
MKKTILTLGLLCTLLNACAYKPIIDTAGKSGTFNTDQAKEISNDLQHCKTMAKENSTFVGNILYWTLSPTMDTKV